MRNTFKKLLFGSIACCGCVIPALGQDALPGSVQPRSFPPSSDDFVGEIDNDSDKRRNVTPEVELQQLLNKMRTSDESKKTEIREKLKVIISEQIDRDIELRKKKLAAIEEKIELLKQQLETRTKNKEQTIQMLMMFAENPDLGLGIPASWLDMMRSFNTNQFQSYGQVPTPSSPLLYSDQSARSGLQGVIAPGNLSRSGNNFERAASPFSDADPFGGGPDGPGDPFSRGIPGEGLPGRPSDLQSLPQPQLPPNRNSKPNRNRSSNGGSLGGRRDDENDPFGSV